MKFIHYLESIAGVAIYPMISLFIFFLFFAVLIVYAIRADKQHISDLENLPLEPNDHSHQIQES
jgi:cbb3-type cytochrome oxidase subunit 3